MWPVRVAIDAAAVTPQRAKYHPLAQFSVCQSQLGGRMTSLLFYLADLAGMFPVQQEPPPGGCSRNHPWWVPELRAPSGQTLWGEAPQWRTKSWCVWVFQKERVIPRKHSSTLSATGLLHPINHPPACFWTLSSLLLWRIMLAVQVKLFLGIINSQYFLRISLAHGNN